MAEHRGTITEAVELLGAAVGGSGPVPGDKVVLLIGEAVPVDEPSSSSSSFPGAMDGGRLQHSA